MKIAFIADPLDDFKIYKDTTYAMMRESAARNHELYVLQQEDLVWHNHIVSGRARRLQLTGDPAAWRRSSTWPVTATIIVARETARSEGAKQTAIAAAMSPANQTRSAVVGSGGISFSVGHGASPSPPSPGRGAWTPRRRRW